MPRGVPKNKINSEAQEQEALFRWADFAVCKYPELADMYHIPNEGKRTVSNGAALRRQGLKKGVPDIFLPAPRGKYHGAYIEMKKIGEKPTTEQKQWLSELAKQGYCCYIADKGWQDASEFLTWYLNLEERK
ncbi:MAG: VRR-NUC domain-containing protein [Clostridia bacterium]|nr:VRR-NUC domain-containing protein [Clostridia bacterium]